MVWQSRMLGFPDWTFLNFPWGSSLLTLTIDLGNLCLFAMPVNVAPFLERLMRNFLWGGHTGSKINYLSLGMLQNKNMAVLAKWGWRFINEKTSWWRQVIRRIHGKESFNWHTVGDSGYNLKSPWISISGVWRKVEPLASFKLGGGTRIAFWTDGWLDNFSLCTKYLSCLALQRVLNLALRHENATWVGLMPQMKCQNAHSYSWILASLPSST